MDRFFIIQDAILRLHTSLKKCNFGLEKKNSKIKELLKLKDRLRIIVKDKKSKSKSIKTI